jgi:hypothetical protein
MKKTLLVMLLVMMVFSLTSCYVKKDELDAAIDSRFEGLMSEALDRMNSDYDATKKSFTEDYAQKSKAMEEMAATVRTTLEGNQTMVDAAIDSRFESLMSEALQRMYFDYDVTKKSFADDYAQKSKAMEEMAATVRTAVADGKTLVEKTSQDTSAFITMYTSLINQHIADCDANIPKKIEKEVNDHLTEISTNTTETLLKLYNSYYESIIDVLVAYAIEDAPQEKVEEIKAIYDDFVLLKQDFYGYLDDGKTLDAIQADSDAIQVALVNTLIAQVTPETIQNTNVLTRIASVDRALTDIQRSKLTKETAAELEALVTVWNTIREIDELATKSNSDYSLFSAIQANYAKLDEVHRAMVYNFDLKQLYAQCFFLDFTPVNGGLAVKARPGYADKLVGVITIPARYEGQKVVEIPANAFQDCSKITSLVIPDTVNSIGFAAFNGCGGLTSISLPFVGRYRKGGNYGEGLFGYAFGSNAYFGGTKVDFGTFRDSDHYTGNGTNHQYYVPTKLTQVTVTSESRLTFHAFFNCSMIEEMNLNQEAISLEDGCFYNCSGIASIDLPYVEAIPASAFEGCSSLADFTINEYATSIGDYAFKGCKNLMRMNSDVDNEFVIPENVKYIGYEAFNGCPNMHSLTIPHIGKQKNQGDFGSRLFGIIFGPSPYFGGTKVDFGTFRNSDHYTGNGTNHQYYVPSKLNSVTVTHDTRVSYCAFCNCRMIYTLRINKEASADVDLEAFKGCVKPTYF